MIDFSTLQGVTIPEGVVTEITDENGVVLWMLPVEIADGPIVFGVEKITSDTYAGSTTYTGESFVLLNIFPKTNGTVTVTYGGLTKTITDTSGVETPNSIQVYFGTFNGVADEMETPASGTLTIDGEYRGVSRATFSSSSKNTTSCACIKTVESLGSSQIIGISLCQGMVELEDITIPASVQSIAMSAFNGCTGLKKINLPKSVKEISMSAFSGCTGLTNITIPVNVELLSSSFLNCTGLTKAKILSNKISSINGAFGGCTNLTSFEIGNNNEHFSVEGAILFNKEKTEIQAYPSVSGHYTFPDSVSSIAASSFHYSALLTSVTIPPNVKSIGNEAFRTSDALTSVNISEGVTEIGANAFSNCTALTSAVFADPSGWYINEWKAAIDSPTGQAGYFETLLDASELSDPSTAATLLSSTHSVARWYRK